ncbi:hypothetical protein KY285_023333 [Solanum tuberosum]|nr:hypothetical protein KY289_023669 [Solanum tuberosum]KAH0675532.1 hypothetical protein KY285_023333 [Solanum tuberosum]
MEDKVHKDRFISSSKGDWITSIYKATGKAAKGIHSWNINRKCSDRVVKTTILVSNKKVRKSINTWNNPACFNGDDTRPSENTEPKGLGLKSRINKEGESNTSCVSEVGRRSHQDSTSAAMEKLTQRRGWWKYEF